MKPPVRIGWMGAVLMLVVGAAGGCASDGNLSSKSKSVYFGSFADYDTPLKLVEQLSSSEALSRPAYLVGDFDDGGRLYRVEKYHGDELFFRLDYRYHANGEVKQSRFFGVDGKERVQYFDETGDLIDAGGNKIKSPFLPKT